jgi:nicotinate-nucleotide pyrophosphorylase (carboxylating)
VRDVVAAALREDGAPDDVTTAYMGIGDRPITARLFGRASGVIAGIAVARAAFELTDGDVRFDEKTHDGGEVHDGDVVAEIQGKAGGILSAERVALNFLQRLSGVATLTAKFADAVRDAGVSILDTRKTTPLLREFERYAVRVGGGRNHRFNLSDMLLVKENHLRTIGSVSALMDLLGRAKPPADIEVEVDSLESLVDMLGAPVDRVMLDNFCPDEVATAVRIVGEYRSGHPGFTAAIEVSGGIDLENVRDYAIRGVDYISIGSLTHSAPALDLSLEVDADGS